MITTQASRLRDGQPCRIGGLRAKVVYHYTNGSVRLALLEDAPPVRLDDLELSERLVRGDEVILPANRFVEVEPLAALWPTISIHMTVPKDPETLV